MAVKGKKYQDSAKTLEKGKLYDPSRGFVAGLRHCKGKI